MNVFRNEKALSGLSVVVVVITIILIIFALRAFEQVDAGHEGIVYDMNKGIQLERPLPPGFNWLNPLTQNVVFEMSTQTQMKQVDASAATKDMQPISVIVALNYRVAEGKTPWMYQNVGIGYADIVIVPALQDTVKTVTAKFPVSQIIDSREIVGRQAEELMRERMSKYNIVVERLNLVNIGLDPEYQKAIIDKQTAEQKVLTEKNNLERIKIEKEQVITAAQGVAESMKIKAEALQKNQNLVSWEAISKWDGKMPVYYITGSQNTGMLFNIPAPTTTASQ